MAIEGPSLTDLWTVGQGGTSMRRDGARWHRVATGTEAFLSGLHRCGRTCAFAWDGHAGRGYGRSTTVVLRYDGEGWSSVRQGIEGRLVGIAGLPGNVWAATEQQLLRLRGRGWRAEVEAADLGDGYHRFVGLCATASHFIAGDGQDGALVWPR